MAKQKRVVFILRTCRTLKHRCQINPTRNLWHVLKMSWINLLLSGKQGRVNSIKSRWSETIGKFHFFIGVKIRVYTTKFCFRNSVFGGSLFQDFQSFFTRNKFCYTKLWFRIQIKKNSREIAGINAVYPISHCLKITQKVAYELFEFWYFPLIKTDLSGNTVWSQALCFQKLFKIDHFWHF